MLRHGSQLFPQQTQKQRTPQRNCPSSSPQSRFPAPWANSPFGGISGRPEGAHDEGNAGLTWHATVSEQHFLHVYYHRRSQVRSAQAQQVFVWLVRGSWSPSFFVPACPEF